MMKPPRALQGLTPETLNSTDPLDLPSKLLEQFLPGFSVLRRFLIASLGFDITLLVTTCLLLVASVTSLRYAGRSILSFGQSWLTATVTINSSDKLYEEVMQWIAKQTLTEDARMLSASTKMGAKAGRHGERTTMGLGAWGASSPPVYSPYFGTHWFWHKGQIIIFKRNQVKANDMAFINGSTDEERETISLSCLGRSSAPIKALILACKEDYNSSRRSMTTIRYASTLRGYSWQTATTRPSRSINTVYMDEQIKKDLLQDVYEFLHPSSPKFYASRGIPYRRGLLFWGPPGTGKTSLSLALAGIFGLELHVLSLVEPTMTDQKLSMLFSALPARCLVLLEDIDTAGLRSRKLEDTAVEATATGAENKEAKDAVAERPKKRGGGGGFWTDEAGEVSLSGLLNALDGVASQEGRILIMTTNDPESLDPALIRPGRVDMQVYFGHLNRGNARQIFLRMFTPDAKDKDMDEPVLLEGELSHHASELEKSVLGNLVEKAELESLASGFAEQMPEETFTPAEIQGFLLTRRKSPRKAVEEFEAWKEEMVAAKKRGKNIIRPTGGKRGAEGRQHERGGSGGKRERFNGGKVKTMADGGKDETVVNELNRESTIDGAEGEILVNGGGKAEQGVKNETMTNGDKDA